MGSHAFIALCDEIKELHTRKSHDYTTGGPFENFERVAYIQSWFARDIDKAFAGMIAVKLARLGSLMGRNKEPNNESTNDSLRDLMVYAGMWAAYYNNPAEKIQTKGYDAMYGIPAPIEDNPFAKFEGIQDEEFVESPEYKKRKEIIGRIHSLDNDQLAKILMELRNDPNANTHNSK